MRSKLFITFLSSILQDYKGVIIPGVGVVFTGNMF